MLHTPNTFWPASVLHGQVALNLFKK